MKFMGGCHKVSGVLGGWPTSTLSSTTRRLAKTIAVLSLVAGLLGVGPVLAQAPSSAATGNLQQQYDDAFQETLRQPANLDALFRFASLAAETGDLEGSISALERMLVINPDLPRVRLELGVLYFRLSSYEVALTYLETALNSAALPSEVRDRGERFMAETRKRLSPSRLSGEAFLGLRFQSNANLGPSSSNVLLFGAPANLNVEATGQPDWGTVSSLQLDHVYDFGNQDRATLETRFTGFANRQFQLNTTNIALAELTTGPRFRVFSGIFEDVTLKPFASVGYVWLYDTPYYGSYGGGLEGTAALTDRLRNQTIFRWRQRNHPSTSYLPSNTQYTGIDMTGATSLQYQLSNVITVFANASGTRFDAALTPTQSYNLWIVGGGMSFRFADPLFKSREMWSITLAFAGQWWSYDAPNVSVDPNTAQQQADSIGSVTLSVPFDDRTTARFSAGRFVRTSNLPNYAFENNTTMFGISWRF